MTYAVEGVAVDPRSLPAGSPTEMRHDPRRRPPGAGAVAANPVVQAIALPELPADPATSPAEAPAAPVVRDWHPLHQIKATLQVRVGEATLTVGELLQAREHQVLRLDRAVDQPVDLTIEGKVVARGQLVALDGHFAVRITELPVALGLKAGT